MENLLTALIWYAFASYVLTCAFILVCEVSKKHPPLKWMPLIITLLGPFAWGRLALICIPIWIAQIKQHR
jgi:hypothetical protein